MDTQQPRRGLHSPERRDAGGSADALVPSSPNPHGFTDVFVPCSHAACPNTDIQQPERRLHLDEQREAHSLTDNLVPARHTRSVGSKKVLSRRRHWREDQLECLRRRAKAKLIRSCGVQYEEEQGRGGIASFSIKGVPVFLMLLVNSVFSFAFSLWFFVELDMLCMISIFINTIKCFPATGAWVFSLSARDPMGFPMSSTLFSVAKEHPRFYLLLLGSF